MSTPLVWTGRSYQRINSALTLSALVTTKKHSGGRREKNNNKQTNKLREKKGEDVFKKDRREKEEEGEAGDGNCFSQLILSGGEAADKRCCVC